MLTYLSLPILFIRWLIEKNSLYQGSKAYTISLFVILNIGPKLLGEQAVFPSIYKLFFFSRKLLEHRIACLSMMDMSLKKFSPYSEAPAATVIYSYKFHFENSQFQVSIMKKMQIFFLIKRYQSLKVSHKNCWAFVISRVWHFLAMFGYFLAI